MFLEKASCTLSWLTRTNTLQKSVIDEYGQNSLDHFVMILNEGVLQPLLSL